MKKARKCLSSLLLAAALTVSFTVPAFAAGSTLTYKGADQLQFSGYSGSDLFGGFKNVMPGDVREESITIRNNATDSDYIKVYLQAIAHDETGNPLTYDEAYEKADGKDQAGVDGQRDETVATMSEFLAQLTMRVWNGSTLIYEASPDKLGGLENRVTLSDKLESGKSVDLKVELVVPIELGNEYANRVGEVDWIIKVESFTTPPPPPPGPGPGPGPDPDPDPDPDPGPGGGGEIIIPGDTPDEPEVEIPEEDVPLAELPQTGLLQWPVPLMALAGVVVFFVGYMTDRKAKRDSED